MKIQKLTRDFSPNKKLEVFAPLIGDWKTIGTHGMIPDTTLHGHTSFTWHESGAFILMQSTIEEEVGIPDGIGILGSDDTLDLYEMLYYDVRGVSRHYHLDSDGSVVKWWRKAPEFSQRTTLTISENSRSMTGIGEISKDCLTWEQDLNLTYSKV